MIKNSKAQASLILILLTAVALIFFALSLNWGRIAQIKTVTMTSATTMAGGMGSAYASYGERVLQTTLGGEWKKCKTGSIMAAIITLVIVIILVIVTWYCGGCGGWATAPIIMGVSLATIAAVAAVALATLNLILQATVVQPGLTRLWNKLQKDNLPLHEQVLAQGLQSGLQGAVTDAAQVTDYLDYNTNGRFGYKDSKPSDTVSRFGFFMTERFKALKAPEDVDLQPFVEGLNTFQGQITQSCSDANDPRCNPCCVPLEVGGKRIRPQNCSTDAVPAGCAFTGVWPYADDYPLSHDPTEPNYATGTSFLAKFGVDAEVRPFVETDAKGIFKFLWEMDSLLTDTNRAPSSKNPANVNSALPADLDTRKSDAVTQITNFKAADDQCTDGLDPATGMWWKKGSDKYCSTTWPYDDCAKFNSTCSQSNNDGTTFPTSCGCTADTAANWPEDSLDDVVYGLKEFNAWARKFNNANSSQLKLTLDLWYPQAAMWLGPPCNGSNAFTCFDGYQGGKGGFLYTYSERLAKWQPMLDNWLNATTYTADDAWCLPPTATGLPTAEVGAINAAGGTWGSLTSVIACLDYNSTNNMRFTQCQSDITAPGFCTGAPKPMPASCQNLPRSLAGNAPAFDPCATTSNYKAWLSNSLALSIPQSAKFKARKDLLTGMKTRAETAKAAIDAFKPQVDNFLAGPAVAALVKAREEYNSLVISGHPDFMIYGWRDPKPPKNEKRDTGYWHVVMAQGQIPMHCASGKCIASRLPWVRTYTKGFLGRTRCFELTDYTGRVFSKVSRWDEEHDAISFANKIPLWKFTFQKPGSYPALLTTLDGACAGIGTWNSIGINNETLEELSLVWGSEINNPTQELLKGAFMISSVPAPGSKEETCYKLVQQLMTRGISSEVCTLYSLSENKKHMEVKFEKCPGGSF